MPPRKRPVLVWVICVLYFLGLLASLDYFLVKLPLISSGAIPVNEALREYIRSHMITMYLSGAIGILSSLAGTIFLFLLRRPALYFLAGSFVFQALLNIFQISCGGFPIPSDATGRSVFVIGLIITNGISVPIIAYVGYLYDTRVLR